MSQKTLTLFRDKIENTRTALIMVIEEECFRVKDFDSHSVDFDEPVDINVCREVDRDIDVRILGLTNIGRGRVEASIEVAEVMEDKPLHELSLDTLLNIYDVLVNTK